MSYQLKKRLAFGCVNYINALPFSLELAKKKDILLDLEPPAFLLKKLIKGDLRMALTSAFGGVSHPFSQVEGFGIAAYQRIMSVTLYAKESFFSPKERIRLAATHDSRSSLILLLILCCYIWDLPCPDIDFYAPQDLIQLPSDIYDGLLLIGDAALRHPTLAPYRSYDLATVWSEATQLPFVFATVLSSDTSMIPYMKEVLDNALSVFEQNPQHVLYIAQERTQLPIDLLTRYYHLCRYRLHDTDYAGLEKFKEYYGKIQQEATYSAHVRRYSSNV